MSIHKLTRSIGPRSSTRGLTCTCESGLDGLETRELVAVEGGEDLFFAWVGFRVVDTHGFESVVELVRKGDDVDDTIVAAGACAWSEFVCCVANEDDAIKRPEFHHSLFEIHHAGFCAVVVSGFDS